MCNILTKTEKAIVIDCKTAPSFARSPKTGVFERVLTRGREMGERGEEGVALAARLLPRPVLPFHDCVSKLAQKLLANEGAVLQSTIVNARQFK